MKRRLALLALIGLAALIGAAATASAISIQRNTYTLDADFVATGSMADQLGSALGAGDWNGDGYGDVLLCSIPDNTCSLSLGRSLTTLSPMRADRPEVTFIGPGGSFGYGAAFVGDANGDGYDDVVIGAPALVGPGAERNAGSAWLFLGRPATVGSSLTLGYYQAQTHLLGAEVNGTLGTAVAAAGDLNGDGRHEFWISASRAAAQPPTLGSVLLFVGRQSWPSQLLVADADLALENVTSSLNSRPAMLGGHDFDGDRKIDFAVGSSVYPNAVGDAVGAVFVFLNPYGRVGTAVGPSAADITVRGTLNISGMGAGLAFAPDFTQSSVATLMVSADFNTSNMAAGGAVYLFRTNGWFCCRTLFGWDAHGLLFNPAEADVGGYSLATGDFDGDGATDLAVGAYNGEAYNLLSAGIVYVFYGRDIGTNPVAIRNSTSWVNGPHSFCMLGFALVMTDFNNDGKADFFAGCPLSLGFEFSNGSVYGFLGRPRNRPPVVTLTGPAGAVEGDSVEITVSISDPDRDRVTWAFDSGGGLTGYDAYPNQPVVNYTLRDEGQASWSVRVFDGEYASYAAHSFSVVNAPPTCVFEIPFPFEEGKNRSIRVLGSDPGLSDAAELLFIWSGPVNMTVNATVSPALAWYTPPRGLPFLVRVDIHDADGGYGSCVSTVQVVNGEPQIYLSAPSVVNEGSVAAIYVETSVNGSEDRVTVSWQTPLGVVEGPIVNWIPNRPGIFTFNVSASDLDGAVVYREHLIRVAAVAPDANLSVPAGIREGEPATLRVNQLSGESFDPLTVSWYICGHPILSGMSYEIARARPGDFCVEALVVDDDGHFLQLRGTFHVENRMPVDGVRVTPPDSYYEGGPLNFEVIFSAWETADPSQINITWRVDGRIAYHGPTFEWKAIAGAHSVTATAQDPAGGQSEAMYTFDVQNVAPTIYIVGPASVPTGVSELWVAFAADPSGIPVTIEWRVDGALASHGDSIKWGTPSRGAHTITATAKDSTGGESTATFNVMVEGAGVAAGIDLGWMPYVLTAGVAFAVGLYSGRMFRPPGATPPDERRRGLR